MKKIFLVFLLVFTCLTLNAKTVKLKSLYYNVYDGKQLLCVGSVRTFSFNLKRGTFKCYRENGTLLYNIKLIYNRENKDCIYFNGIDKDTKTKCFVWIMKNYKIIAVKYNYSNRDYRYFFNEPNKK